MPQCTDPITFQYMILDFMKQNKFLLVCYILLVLLVPLQDIGIPHIIGMLTKNIKENTSLILPLILLLVLISIIQIGVLINGILEINIYPKFQAFIRNTIIQHIMKEMKTNYEEVQTGSLIMHLHKFPGILYSYFEDSRNILIPQTIVYIGAIMYFSYYDIYIGLGLFIVLGIVICSIFYTIDNCFIISKTRDHKYNSMMEEISDMMKNSVSILNANSENFEMERNSVLQEDYYTYSRNTLYCTYNTIYYLIPLIIVFFAWVLYRLYKHVKDGKLESYKMISIVLILIYIMKSMLQIINEIKDHVFKWGSMQNSLEIFNNCAPVEKHIDIIPSDIPNGFVLKNITYSYNDKYSKPVFDHYNLVIELNKITLVVGEIGSGKSTLIKLLMKYQLPQEGTIYYNKRPYSSINVDELRTIIGYVPQVPVLFNRTVYENIVYNNTSVTENDVFELMKQLGIDDMIYKFKDGLQTNVGIGGSKLSGGQRQIVWLLRIILQNPEVIILDEPTSALDDDTKPIVQNMIKNIIKNKTIIMITHDKYLYQFADTIISL